MAINETFIQYFYCSRALLLVFYVSNTHLYSVQEARYVRDINT